MILHEKVSCMHACTYINEFEYIYYFCVVNDQVNDSFHHMKHMSQIKDFFAKSFNFQMHCCTVARFL